MAVYELRSNFDLNVDGVMVPSHSVLGILTTELEVGNVLSATAFGRATAVLISATPAAPFQRSAPEPAPPVQTENKNLAEQVDALNADPIGDDATDKDVEPVPATKQREPIANPFEGLAPRISDALLAAGFETRAAVAKLASTGSDAFLDLDGIGKSAARQIMAWLGEE